MKGLPPYSLHMDLPRASLFKLLRTSITLQISGPEDGDQNISSISIPNR